MTVLLLMQIINSKILHIKQHNLHVYVSEKKLLGYASFVRFEQDLSFLFGHTFFFMNSVVMHSMGSFICFIFFFLFYSNIDAVLLCVLDLLYPQSYLTN